MSDIEILSVFCKIKNRSQSNWSLICSRQLNLLQVAAEKFTQQYIEAVKKNTRNDFIHFYQLLDVLIIDDVQFLSGKSGTQDVFFHIY